MILIVLYLWKGGVFIQFLWVKRLLSLGGGGGNQEAIGVLVTKVVQSTCAVQPPAPCHHAPFLAFFDADMNVVFILGSGCYTL